MYIWQASTIEHDLFIQDGKVEECDAQIGHQDDRNANQHRKRQRPSCIKLTYQLVNYVRLWRRFSRRHREYNQKDLICIKWYFFAYFEGTRTSSVIKLSVLSGKNEKTAR